MKRGERNIIGNTGVEERPQRDLGHLRRVVPYLRPYRLASAGALAALTAASGAVLVMGVGLRTLVDEGFRGSDGVLLDQALIALFVIIAVLTAATYARFFLVSWIGERVVADIRGMCSTVCCR